MNKQRRESLSKLFDELEIVKNLIVQQLGTAKIEVDKLAEEYHGKLEDLKTEVETLKDEEQEYYDNMPAGFQNGEKGSAASEAIDNMDTAMSKIDEVMDKLTELKDFTIEGELDGLMEEATEAIDNAKGEQ